MLFLIRCAPLALMLAAAQLHAQGMNMPRERHSAAATPAPLVKAEVRSIDPLKRTVTLNHEDIPNVGMSAMTMAFDVADKKMLKGIKAGDKVRVRVDSVKGKLMVTKLERST